MLLKYFYDPKLAQASYMVACQAAGVAIVIDPARDIRPYLATAEAEGLRITHVTETHIHADYVSGTRELAAATGATMYLSDEGGHDWRYAYPDRDIHLLKDGDTFMVGNIRFEALHTPGHTPEHMCYQITDTAAADRPIGIFTGDFIFVGTVGRPDLLEEAAGIANTKEPGARQQFANIQRFQQLPDYLQIWPGHGAGSACGKGLGSIPSTTLGYEKLFNPAFQFDDEDRFVEWLLRDQPEAPRYFARMKYVNRVGPALLRDLPQPQQLPAEQLAAIAASDAQLIDARMASEFIAGHIAGSLHAPPDSDRFSTYIGWYIDYERPTYLIAHEQDVERLITELRAIGVDNLRGYFTPDAIQGETVTTAELTPQEALTALEQGALLVDVRDTAERVEQHIGGSRHIPMGFLPRHLDELPRDRLIILHCAGGVRSLVAASVLQQHGFTNVASVAGGLDRWLEEQLPSAIPMHH